MTRPRAVGRFAAAGPVVLAVVVGVVARAFYTRRLLENPAFLEPVLDAAAHVEWARGLADGSWPGPAPFFRAPGYVYFLGTALAAFGDDPVRVALFQLFAGVVTPVLVAMLATRLFGRAAGAIAGVGAAVHPTLAFFDGQLLATFLAVPLTVAATLVTVAALETPRRAAAAGAALLWSAVAIVRPPLLLPGLLLPVAWWRRGSAPVGVEASGGAEVPDDRRPRRFPGATLLVALVLLLPLLVTVRNAVRGDAAFIATQGGLNFQLGNGSDADGMAATFAPAPGAVGYRMLDAAQSIAERESGRELRPSEVSAFWFRRTGQEIVAAPGRWIALLGKKAILFLGAREIPNNHDPALFRRELDLPVLPGWGFWLAFAGAGAWFSRRNPGARFAGGVVLLVAAGCVLFFVNARFRLPAAPLLVVLGAGGIVGLVRAIREAPRTVVLPGGIALLLALAAFSNPYGVPDEPAPTAYVLLAEAERNHGEPVRALRWIDRALEVEPGLYVAHMARLDLLRSMGREAEALRAAERMLVVRPDDAALLQRAAILRDLAGDAAGGLALLDRALAIEPTLPGAQLDRAILLIRSGRATEARPELVVLAARGTEAERARARRVLTELDAGTLVAAPPSRLQPDQLQSSQSEPDQSEPDQSEPDETQVRR
jgi:hypothetical protein